MLAFASAAQSLTLPSPDSLYAPGKLRRNSALTDALVRGSTAVGFEKDKGKKSTDTEAAERALAYAYRLEIDSHIAQKKNGEIPTSNGMAISVVGMNDGHHVSLADVNDEVVKNNSAKVSTASKALRTDQLSQLQVSLFPMSVAQQQQLSTTQQQSDQQQLQQLQQQQQPKSHSRSSDRSQRLEMERTVAAIIKQHDAPASVASSMDTVHTEVAQHVSPSPPSSSDSKEDDTESSGGEGPKKRQRTASGKRKDKKKQVLLLVPESSVPQDQVYEPVIKKERLDPDLSNDESGKATCFR